MKQWSLCFLWRELEGRKAPPPDLEAWFTQKRQTDGGEFFKYLVESPGKIEKFYTLYADPNDPEVAILEGADLAVLGDSPTARLPFSKPSGPNSPQLGPVMKRAYIAGKGAAPGKTILQRTLDAFHLLADSSEPWAEYFAEVAEVWSRPRLKYAGTMMEMGSSVALFAALQAIPETNATVFFTYRNGEGKYPGDIPEYVAYLSEILAKTKYATKAALPRTGQCCPLCGQIDTTVYATACSGAGINIANIDREGAFPGVNKDLCHLGYALCLDCADQLFTFHFCLERKLVVSVAGERALVLPHLNSTAENLARVTDFYEQYLDSLSRGQARTDIEKRYLPHYLGDSQAIGTIDIIWADFGNKMENIKGQILEILPSRFRLLTEFNQDFEVGDLAVAPEHWDADEFRFNLNLSFLKPLFKRPGGKKAKNANSAARLFRLKQGVAEAIFHGSALPEKRFWDELMETASWYLLDTLDSDSPDFSLLHEGYSEKKNTVWLTMAGWVRHLAVCLHYFRKLNLINEKEMTVRTFVPNCEKLTSLFEEGTGINSDEKAFAFMLGLLFGRLVTIQAARGVNVSSNSLTWLKRLTLEGKDLPELFIRVREKLLAYDAEKAELLREVIADISRLGLLLGDEIDLEQTQTCYFLLLGQAMAAQTFNKKSQ
jgi:CRISPR-associated protein Csh1